jgi:hypothetical protein
MARERIGVREGVVGLCAALVIGGCVLDWDRSHRPSGGAGGSSGTTGASGGAGVCGGSCACPEAGEFCTLACETSGCSFQCGEASFCSVSCPGGGCDVDCGSSGFCSVSCEGGGCTLACHGGGLQCTCDGC